MHVTNLLFWVTDNTLSAKFYKKLGFEIIHSDDEYSEVMLGNFRIGLVSIRDEAEFAGDSMAGERGKGMYVYINVDDVDAWYRQLCQINITPKSQPRDWAWGNREFVVKDPDGYKLCFWQKISKKA